LDWKTRDKKKILEEVNKISNFDGRIILMHSIYNSTAEAVEELVPQLLSKGYQLVTVSEMAKYKEKTLQTSTVYYNFR
jgi:peptidoglycan/xylan/chitin deacetylase (PgdA/CDA1 family)